MSVYISEKSLKKHGPLDEPRDPSRLLHPLLSFALCVLLAPLGAAAFAAFLLFVWTFAIPLAVVGLIYIFRKSRA